MIPSAALLAAALLVLSVAAVILVLPRLRRGYREEETASAAAIRSRERKPRSEPPAARNGSPGSDDTPPSAQAAHRADRTMASASRTDGTQGPNTSFRLDLSVLAAAPSPADSGPERFLSEARMGEVRALAGEVSHQIQARQGLIDALSDSPEDPAELTRAVTQDPALAGQILKTVNSPSYGLREPLASVFRAVLYLGHIEVRNIIWRVCFADAVWMTPSPADSTMLDAFWAHSFQTSRIAYAAGRMLELPNPDVLATSALLHDIGKLLAWQLWPEKARTVYANMGFSDAAAQGREWDDLGIDHTVLGAETAAVWMLPHDVRMSVEHHHAPSYRGPDLFGPAARSVMVVHLADLLGHLSTAPGTSDTVLPYQPQDGWWDVLGVSDPGAFCAAVLSKAALPGRGCSRATGQAA